MIAGKNGNDSNSVLYRCVIPLGWKYEEYGPQIQHKNETGNNIRSQAMQAMID